jgi:hypothetical protein
MTKHEMQKALQNELTAAGFENKIWTLYDEEPHTVIIFAEFIRPKQLAWLNERFMNGVTLVEEGFTGKGKKVRINTPIENNKGK